MVIEVTDELKALGDAMVAPLAPVTKARAGTKGGRAVDYGAVEMAIGEAVAGSERAGHQLVLQSLDVDLPAVLIGGVRHAKVHASRGAPPPSPPCGSLAAMKSEPRRAVQTEPR